MKLDDRFQILLRAAKLARDGLILEFGVANGRSLNFLAEFLRPRRVYGFDSFRGLPEPWANYPIGHFACAAPAVANNVELVIGAFADTLPAFLATHPQHAALIHIDCDLYSSTRTVLEAFALRIVPGTVIVLDEYWIEPEQEQAAFKDFLFMHGRACRHDCYAAEQLCVVMQ